MPALRVTEPESAPYTAEASFSVPENASGEKTQDQAQPLPEIIAAVSGGADSVCLLLILNTLRHEGRLRLKCMHVHHGIRKETADRDAEFVRALCKRLDIPFVLHSCDVPVFAAANALSIEDAARKLRYEALFAEAKDTGYIATAHHRDDVAETLLFRLFRGAGLHGLTGIPPVRGRIIRPLLCLSREEIEAYLAAEGETYVTDETNADNTFSRNYIRNVLLPEINAHINAQASAHIADTASRLAEADAYLTDMVLQAYRTCAFPPEQGAIALSLSALRALPPFLQKEVLLHAFTLGTGGRNNIGNAHLSALAALIAGDAGGKELHLPGRVTVRRSGRRILFEQHP